MKTTIDIPDRLLKETIKRTQARTKREAVGTTLEKLFSTETALKKS